MIKNRASQNVAASLVSKTDGSSITTGTTTVYVTGDGGTQGTGGGTVTHEGNGQWNYAPTAAETNYDHIAFTFVNTNAVTTTVNVYPRDLYLMGVKDYRETAQAYAAGTLTLVNGTNAHAGDWITIVSATTGAGQTVQISSIDSSVSTAKVASVDPDFSPTLSGTVVYIAATGPRTLADVLPLVNVGQVGGTTITGGIDLSTAIPAIAAQLNTVLAGPNNGGIDFTEAMYLICAALLAKCSGMEATSATGTFRNLADTANAITVTKDAHGNRTAITLNP